MIEIIGSARSCNSTTDRSGSHPRRKVVWGGGASGEPSGSKPTTVDDIVTGGDIPNNRAVSFDDLPLEIELENNVTLDRPVETAQ